MRYRAPVMAACVSRWIAWARSKRWAHLAVANLRIFIGFAFVPAGLKKILDQPFTDPANTGAFHEFLHAFYASGFFYQVVGAVQLCAGALLMTQRFATAGAFVALPLFTAICAFCWSTGAYPTAAMVTLMLLGTAGLALWDWERWRAVLSADDRALPIELPSSAPLIDAALWRRAGAAVLGFYLLTCALSGGVYRPRGVEIDQPGFYVFPIMLCIPLGALWLERRRQRLR